MSTGPPDAYRPPAKTYQPPSEDSRLLDSLRAGEESAFRTLLDRYHSSMWRLAMLYAPNRSVAEEVVAETWLGVLRGLERFEGRSSLKTWIFSILINVAKTRARQESRTIPFSALESTPDPAAEPSVEPQRFRPEGDRWPGHWTTFPHNWDEIPEERLLSQEVMALAREAIERLEPTQREVITLRDIEGWSSGDVCNVLRISETNQRVLLHRARSKVRRALEAYFDDAGLSRPTR